MSNLEKKESSGRSKETHKFDKRDIDVEFSDDSSGMSAVELDNNKFKSERFLMEKNNVLSKRIVSERPKPMLTVTTFMNKEQTEEMESSSKIPTDTNI